jgi:hypothetical protein
MLTSGFPQPIKKKDNDNKNELYAAFCLSYRLCHYYSQIITYSKCLAPSVQRCSKLANTVPNHVMTK